MNSIIYSLGLKDRLIYVLNSRYYPVDLKSGTVSKAMRSIKVAKEWLRGKAKKKIVISEYNCLTEVENDKVLFSFEEYYFIMDIRNGTIDFKSDNPKKIFEIWDGLQLVLNKFYEIDEQVKTGKVSSIPINLELKDNLENKIDTEYNFVEEIIKVHGGLNTYIPNLWKVQDVDSVTLEAEAKRFESRYEWNSC